MISAKQIVEKARSLGYDKCGIIPVQQMSGYEEKLELRMKQFPETRPKMESLRSFAAPQTAYPWAKSIVICAYWYGKYQLPEQLKGRIGTHYLTDGRTNPSAPKYQASLALEAFLKEQGLQVACDRRFGLTALRWAAQEAGIGIIRNNNFFYTERGSWVTLEAFLIDQPLEYTETCTLPPCPDTCTRCRDACPTGSLSAPFSMNRNTCVSCLTTWESWDLTKEPLRDRLGDWIYGCDACQNACPHNHRAWTDDEEFPGLEALGRRLSLCGIVEMDYDELERTVQPLLWYIPAEKSWRYKVNALNAMYNRMKPEYLPVIAKACRDEKEPVRQMAEWVLHQLHTETPTKP